MKKVDVEDTVHMHVKRFGKRHGLTFEQALISALAAGIQVIDLLWDKKNPGIVYEDCKGELLMHELSVVFPTKE